MAPTTRHRSSVQVSRDPPNSWSVISDYMTLEVEKGGTGATITNAEE